MLFRCFSSKSKVKLFKTERLTALSIVAHQQDTTQRDTPIGQRMVFESYYARLAENPTDSNLWKLMYFAVFDERVYNVVAEKQLIGTIADQLPSPAAAHFLSRGIVYDPVNVEVMSRFIRICSYLSRYEGVEQGATLSELLGSCGWPEENRRKLFNFSETYRHLAIGKSYFPQRGVLKLLSYIFCDDYLDDCVATLQYKTDILNHVNTIFVKTSDFTSWRFSVRALSLAGGFNEDRSDVDQTEEVCRFVTKAIPEFVTYFGVAFAYGMFRHYPNRVKGIVPRWLRRHRAYFTGFVCGCLGVYMNTYLEYKIHRERLRYELRKSQEFRRRRGADRRGTFYEHNTYFDNLQGITRRIYAMQAQTYIITASFLALTFLPLTNVRFPKFMGDVPFRHPTIPRLFPALVGLKTSSRCLIPYVFVPFAFVSVANAATWGVSLYDRYVEMRQKMYVKQHGFEDDNGKSTV